jgi:hypothetical protein
VREWGGRPGRQLPGLHRGAQRALDEPEPVAQPDRAPAFEAEDRGRVEQGDPAHLLLGAHVEPRLGARAQGRQRVLRARGTGGAGQALGELGLELLEDRREELGLPVELVVERAARDPRGADDLLGADGAEAALREERAGRADEGGARCLRACGVA